MVRLNSRLKQSINEENVWRLPAIEWNKSDAAYWKRPSDCLHSVYLYIAKNLMFGSGEENTKNMFIIRFSERVAHHESRTNAFLFYKCFQIRNCHAMFYKISLTTLIE